MFQPILLLNGLLSIIILLLELQLEHVENGALLLLLQAVLVEILVIQHLVRQKL